VSQDELRLWFEIELFKICLSLEYDLGVDSHQSTFDPVDTQFRTVSDRLDALNEKYDLTKDVAMLNARV